MKTVDDTLQHLLIIVRQRLTSMPLEQSCRETMAAILSHWPSHLTKNLKKNMEKNIGENISAHNYIEQALKIGESIGDKEICSLVRQLIPSLSWFFGYAEHPDFPHLDQKVWFSQFVGPDDLWTSAHLAIGLTLIAPNTLYPAHRHPATELYLPLSGTGLWSMGSTDYHPRKPGELIIHHSNVPHATQAQEAPVLALYIWQGDINSPSKWQ